MPIKEIQRYAALRTKGEATLSARMEMLVFHRKALAEQRSRLEEHMEKLEEKIDFYRREIERTAEKQRAGST